MDKSKKKLKAHKPADPIKTLEVLGGDQKGELKCLGGSNSDKWNQLLANQVIASIWRPSDTPIELVKERMAGNAAALYGITPRDEIEGMLAAQMVASHNAAMECYRRAMIPEQTFVGRHDNLNQANKLSRTYASLVEALNRHRGKGQQKVTVEHVHVHAGGQAVVGVVGGGDQSKLGGQGDEFGLIEHVASQAVWGENETRDGVPVPCNAERSMPDARGTVKGST